MPKMKTNSGAKKRIKPRGKKGSLKVHGATRRHLLTKKSPKVKRQSQGTKALSPSDVNNAQRMLCIK